MSMQRIRKHQSTVKNRNARLGKAKGGRNDTSVFHRMAKGLGK